jgi:hypothetical protein
MTILGLELSSRQCPSSMRLYARPCQGREATRFRSCGRFLSSVVRGCGLARMTRMRTVCRKAHKRGSSGSGPHPIVISYEVIKSAGRGCCCTAGILPAWLGMARLDSGMSVDSRLSDRLQRGLRSRGGTSTTSDRTFPPCSRNVKRTPNAPLSQAESARPAIDTNSAGGESVICGSE